jgi:hypothetical protein
MKYKTFEKFKKLNEELEKGIFLQSVDGELVAVVEMELMNGFVAQNIMPNPVTTDDAELFFYVDLDYNAYVYDKVIKMKEISEKEAMKLFDKQGEYDPEEL